MKVKNKHNETSNVNNYFLVSFVSSSYSYHNFQSTSHTFDKVIAVPDHPMPAHLEFEFDNDSVCSSEVVPHLLNWMKTKLWCSDS